MVMRERKPTMIGTKGRELIISTVKQEV